MADLGDIGVSMGVAEVFACRSAFGLNAQTYGNTATGSGTANAIVRLSTSAGANAGVTRADAGGDWHFYDLDDGTYYASEVGSVNAWEIEVSGASATVTALSGGGGGGGSTGHFSFG